MILKIWDQKTWNMVIEIRNVTWQTKIKSAWHNGA